MIIDCIETFSTQQLCIVRLRTENGAVGFGQASPFNADITASVLHRQVAPHFLAQDPAQLEALVTRCIEANYKFPWSYVCRALTGVETALWDLRGKTEGTSVCELLGGIPRALNVYGSSMSRAIKPEEEAERLLGLRERKGFSAFKIRIGSVCGHDRDAWPGRTEAIIPTVRKAVGDDVSLLADANSCYTPEKAIEVGHMLEDSRFAHFEEPCPYWELEWTARVSEALDIDVAGGEQDNDLAQWRRMIGMKAVDVVQPDVCYVGGIVRAREVAETAHRAGLKCVPHSANLSLVTVFTLHLMAAIPNAGPYVEFSIEEADWVRDLYSPALSVVDGRVSVPDGPGWGIEINPDWLDRAQRQVNRAK